jgi:transposase
MDMSLAFVRAAKEMIPFAESKIVYNKFHFMKMANDAIHKVRRGEHKRLLKDGDDRFKGSK